MLSLSVACLNGQDVVVGELIASGAALNLLNNKGQVCVHLKVKNIR